MTILTSIILVVAITAVALFIAYNVQKGTKTLEELRANYSESEELQEIAELAQELYNKDLRPTVAKKAPKKDKITEQVESMKKVVEAHDTLVEEIAKISPDTTTVNVEVALEQLKEQVSTTDIAAVKPKKKRKYYPKAPKGKS